MGETLRVLNVEDSDRDVALLHRYLTRAGYDLTFDRVQTREAMLEALASREWDVILSDYSMPQFNALQVIATLKETGLDIPLIIISGTIGEEVAVEAMRRGASDYLMKDNLARLVPTIQREKQEAENRRARRQAEEKLKASEAELRALFAAMTDVIVVLDSDGRYLKIAPTDPAYSHRPSADLIGKTLYEVFPKADAEFFLEHIHRALNEDRMHRVEYSLQVEETTIWFEGCVSPMSKDSVIWVARDMTERRRAEEALREANQALESLVQTSPLAIIALDLDGYVKTWNSAAERIFGFTEEEAVGRRNPIISEDRLEEFYNSLETTRRGGLFTAVETTQLKKDGSLIEVSLSAAPLVDGKGHIHGSVVVMGDITERRHLENQLRQSQKMEAIGRLAGGIAHDFNNLLTAIIGYSQLALVRLGSDSPLRKDLEEVEKAGRRAASLTSQLLAFSRKQVVQPRLLEINALVDDLSHMLKRMIGEDIQLSTKLASGTGLVRADRGQIEQIILNLAVNSRDAMPEGGMLTIETAVLELDEAYISNCVDARPGPHVMLAITDNGSGIDKETQSQVFEPFFTTKREGKGTGLGLATVYGIVKQNGGHIELYSELGIGTTFKVYLPCVEDADASIEAQVSEPCRGGDESILLVEDEPAVRKLARAILEAEGYRVFEATTLDETLAICQRLRGPIHLLLTDIVMPGASGREIAQILAPMRPEMKVLYMSGYTDDSIVRLGVLEADTHFLQKPFTRDALLLKVRRVLEERAKARIAN